MKSRISSKYPLKGYICAEKIGIDSWYEYAKEEIYTRKLQTRDDLKVHISLSHEDPENLRRGCEIIAHLLLRANVSMFKMLWYSSAQGFQNQYGKEVTIYMQRSENIPDFAHECPAEFWLNLLADIENALIAEKIQPNQLLSASLGDYPFPGSKGYVFYRNPENVLCRYVEAYRLTYTGFTRYEAFTMSDDIFRDEWFKNKMLHTNESPVDQVKSADTSIEKILVPSKYKFNSLNKENIPHLHGTYEAYQTDLRGKDAKGQTVFTGMQSDMQKTHYETMINLFTAIMISTDKTDQPQLKLAKKLFHNYLKQAAEIYCIIYNGLFMQHGDLLPDAMGNITPAIYHYFFKPLATTWKLDTTKSINQVIDESQLIENIVKASLRKRIECLKGGEKLHIPFAQIYFNQPQYVLDLSEKEISQLYQQARELVLPKNKVATDQKLAQLNLTRLVGIENLASARDSSTAALPKISLAIKSGLTLHAEQKEPVPVTHKRKRDEENTVDITRISSQPLHLSHT